MPQGVKLMRSETLSAALAKPEQTIDAATRTDVAEKTLIVAKFVVDKIFSLGHE
jgi:hypothetical protein